MVSLKRRAEIRLVNSSSSSAVPAPSRLGFHQLSSIEGIAFTCLWDCEVQDDETEGGETGREVTDVKSPIGAGFGEHDRDGCS